MCVTGIVDEILLLCSFCAHPPKKKHFSPSSHLLSLSPPSPPPSAAPTEQRQLFFISNIARLRFGVSICCSTNAEDKDSSAAANVCTSVGTTEREEMMWRWSRSLSPLRLTSVCTQFIRFKKSQECCGAQAAAATASVKALHAASFLVLDTSLLCCAAQGDSTLKISEFQRNTALCVPWGWDAVRDTVTTLWAAVIFLFFVFFCWPVSGSALREKKAQWEEGFVLNDRQWVAPFGNKQGDLKMIKARRQGDLHKKEAMMECSPFCLTSLCPYKAGLLCRRRTEWVYHSILWWYYCFGGWGWISSFAGQASGICSTSLFGSGLFLFIYLFCCYCYHPSIYVTYKVTWVENNGVAE